MHSYLNRWRRREPRSERFVPNRGTEAHRNAMGSVFGSLLNRTERLSAIDPYGAQIDEPQTNLVFDSLLKTRIEDD